jgi:hypothetical protein
MGGCSLVKYWHIGHTMFSSWQLILAEAWFVCWSREPIEEPYFQVEQDCEAAEEEAA